MAFLRWALVTIPLVELLGIASGQLSGSGFGNPWFDALLKPGFMPPGWAFAVIWPILYALMGLALGIILAARGARGRGVAITLFIIQLILNLAWSPLFFAAHQVTIAFGVVVAMLVAAVATAASFARIRPGAALLLVPYIAWLVFAALLNFEIMQLNPSAETLVPGANGTQIEL